MSVTLYSVEIATPCDDPNALPSQLFTIHSRIIPGKGVVHAIFSTETAAENYIAEHFPDADNDPRLPHVLPIHVHSV